MNFIKMDDSPQIDNCNNIQEYQMLVESYVDYNSESNYDKCSQEIYDQNLINDIERNCR